MWGERESFGIVGPRDKGKNGIFVVPSNQNGPNPESCCLIQILTLLYGANIAR
jgi:hypothetical protein